MAATTTSSRTTGSTAALRIQEDVVTTVGARRALAVLRYATGFIFLWAFLDKTFGLGYSTTSDKSWLNGGTPSQGFMKGAATGPFKTLFANMASPATDVLFMLGMLAVGAAVMLGIGLKVSAWAGSLIMVLMWTAEWPFIKGTTNPLVDYHIIYALALIVIALTFAGDTWGLGKWWRSQPIVAANSWLR
ncbi:membrane protein [Actinomycetota bacterium]|nr:membrane protein [Actinomycetota bacterium]